MLQDGSSWGQRHRPRDNGMAFNTETSQSKGYPVLALSGEADLTVTTDLRRALDLLEKQGDRVIVDLSDVTYIDSSALGVLIAYSARLHERGAALVIVSDRDGLRRIFQTRGLVDLLCFVDRRDEAAARLDSTRPEAG